MRKQSDAITQPLRILVIFHHWLSAFEREHLVYQASAYVLCSRIGTFDVWMCKLESKASEILQKERGQKSAGIKEIQQTD